MQRAEVILRDSRRRGTPEQPAIATYTFGTPEFFTWWQQVGERFAIDSIEGAPKQASLSVSDVDVIISHQSADMLYDVWIERKRLVLAGINGSICGTNMETWALLLFL